jgi:hypothetical protein
VQAAFADLQEGIYEKPCHFLNVRVSHATRSFKMEANVEHEMLLSDGLLIDTDTKGILYLVVLHMWMPMTVDSIATRSTQKSPPA